MTVGALPLPKASLYIGLEEGSRWLTEPDCPVPRCDLRKPGKRRAEWVWRIADLDAFLASRLIQPGQPNPWDQG